MFAVSIRRLHHEAVAIVAGLTVVAVVAVITGSRIDADYRTSGLAQCLAAGSRGECESLISRFGDRFDGLQVLVIPLILLPALLGAFVGGPLVARELEAGTHRFLWTQGVTRRRWYAASVVAAVTLAAVAGAVYSGVAALWLDTTNAVTDERFGRLYDFQGALPVAASVFAVAAGIAAGAYLRRTVPAMASTIGIFVVVRMAVATVLRPRIASAETITVPYTSADPLDGTGAWTLSNHTVDSSGAVLGSNGSLDIRGLIGRCDGLDGGSVGRLPDPEVVERCLRDLDVHTVIRYQPGDRYWQFQLLESAVLLGAAAVFVALGTVALSRRAV